MLSKSSLQIPVVSKLGLGERDVLCTEKWETLNSCGIWVQILALHLQAVLAPKGIHNEVAQAGGLKQQTFFISQLWSLEVEIKVWVPPEELQRNLLQVPPPPHWWWFAGRLGCSLACRHVSPTTVFISPWCPPTCASVSVSECLLLIRTRRDGLGTHPTA